MSEENPMEKFKVKPLQRLTSSFWNALIDELVKLYKEATRGSGGNPYPELHVEGNAFVGGKIYSGGKPVIRDGDPVGISTISDDARDKITEALDRSAIKIILEGLFTLAQNLENLRLFNTDIVYSSHLGEYDGEDSIVAKGIVTTSAHGAILHIYWVSNVAGTLKARRWSSNGEIIGDEVLGDFSANRVFWAKVPVLYGEMIELVVQGQPGRYISIYVIEQKTF